MTTVIYHANCADGFCAAWIASKFLEGREVEYIPAQYGDDPPNVEGKDVYVLDFSYPRPTLLAMKEAAANLVVIDHHKTAAEDLKGLDFCIFDMQHSGARITWNYCVNRLRGSGATNPERMQLMGLHLFPMPLSPPWIVGYVEDRDLWKWELPDSREVNACLRSYMQHFDIWDLLIAKGKQNCIGEGMAILRNQNQVVRDHVNQAREVSIGEHKVLCVNATTLQSEIAGALAEDRPFGAVYMNMGSETVFSLRSRDSGIDVSEVAKSFGGGGRRNAAGFKVSTNKFFI